MDEQKHHQKNATHAPAETSSEHENEQFYNGLNETVASIPKQNFVIIAGSKYSSQSNILRNLSINNRNLRVP